MESAEEAKETVKMIANDNDALPFVLRLGTMLFLRKLIDYF